MTSSKPTRTHKVVKVRQHDRLAPLTRHRDTGWHGEPKKNAVVLLRLSAEEKEAFSEAAARSPLNQGLSEWLRGAAAWRLRLEEQEAERARGKKADRQRVRARKRP